MSRSPGETCERGRLVAGGVVAALLILGAGSALFGSWPAALAGAAVLGVAYLSTRFWGRSRAAWRMLALFSAAFAIRLLLLFSFQWLAPDLDPTHVPLVPRPALPSATAIALTQSFSDERKYERVAAGIADHWRGVGLPPRDGNWLDLVPAAYLAARGEAFSIRADVGAQYLLPHVQADAALYLVLGRDPTAVRTLHAALGALFPLLIFALARGWVGAGPAHLAGWFAVFEPSLVFWSPWLMKDMLTVVLVALGLLMALRGALRRARPQSVLVLGASHAVLALTRGPLASFLGLLLPLASLASRRGRRDVALYGLVVLVTVGGALWVGGQGFLGSAQFNDQLQARLWRFRARSVSFDATTAITDADGRLYRPQVGERVPLPELPPGEALARNLGHFPIGLANVLGAPFPWLIRSTSEGLALLYSPVWYSMLALSVAGFVVGWRSRWRVLMLPAAYVVATLLYLSVTETSVGTIVRHRLLLLPVLLPMAAYGFTLARQAIRQSIVSTRPGRRESLAAGR